MEELAKSAAQAAIMAVHQPSEAIAVESFLNAYEHAIKIIKEKQERKEMDKVFEQSKIEADKIFDMPTTTVPNNEPVKNGILAAASRITREDFDNYMKELTGYPSYVDPNHPDNPDYDNIFTSPRL